MGIASLAAKAASKVANKAKEGIKKKLKGEDDGVKQAVKQRIKMFLIVKVGIPLAAWTIVVSAISLVMGKIFGDSNTSISVASNKIKTSIESGTLKGDKDQIEFASNLEKLYGSCIGFTVSQLDTIYDDTIKDLEGKDATIKETYTSNYGTLTTDNKNEIVDKYNEVKDKEDKGDKDYDIINFYNLSREGKFKNMISPYDKKPIYKHILLTEKYNFNNIKWKAYYHNSDEVNDVSKDNMKYDTTYDLLYPSANANVKDLINLVSPYLLSSRIPLSFLAGSMYSTSESDQSIGVSWAEHEANLDQGKNNEIGNFTYEIIKHGGSKIVMNQYNLESRTVSSYWLDYDTYNCKDTIKIEKYLVDIDDGNGNSHKEARYRFKSIDDFTKNEGNFNDSNKTGEHQNTRWNENKEETPEKETPVGDPQYGYSVQYKLGSAVAFDVNVTNSFNYHKYSNEDADKRINEDMKLSESKSRYMKVTGGTHLTEEELKDYTSDQLKALANDSGSTNGNYPQTLTVPQKYTCDFGWRNDITRYWSDSISAQPLSQTKTLLSTSNVITYNKNEDGDPSMDTIAEADFNADTESKNYYDRFADAEGTAMNNIDLLNSNPKIFIKYCDNSSKYSKYVGYNRANYAYSQGISYLRKYLKQLEKDNNGALPFVYGATFGFDVNATANSGIFGASGMALLREYINTWEPVNNYMRTESGAPTTNEEDCKYYLVFIDSVGVPTVGYGININAHFDKIVEAMSNLSIDFPYSSASEIKGKVQAGEAVLMDKAAIDSVQEKLLQKFVDDVKSYTSGIELTEYQLFALTDRAYNGWNPIHGKTFSQAYGEYWNQEKDDKYKALYEKYKDNQTAKDSIVAEIDFKNPLYVNFMKYTTGNAEVEAANGGWTTRRNSEFILFSGGYFLGGYSKNEMLKFWTQAMSPGNINLYKADGSIDETACYNLQLWYEQYWFSNKFHAGPNLKYYRSIPTGGHNNDPLGALNPEMLAKYEPPAERGLRYQCSWWSCVRANMFLVDNNTGKWLYGTPNGKDVASMKAAELGLPYNTNIDNLRPNSLISWTSASAPQYGHTGWVEAVYGDTYVTSECGGGETWGGVILRSKSADRGKFVGSVCLEDLIH